MKSVKQQRTAEQIKTILSDLLLRALNDPRLRLTTVTDVTIDRELYRAHVYVHALGDDSREEEVMAGLKSAHGFIRREVAQRLSLRTAPQLHFQWDPVIQQAERIDSLLDNLAKDNQQSNKQDTES